MLTALAIGWGKQLGLLSPSEPAEIKVIANRPNIRGR